MIIERQLPKRVLSVFLALLMIFTLIPMNVISVNAAENEKAHIKIGTATAMPGETVELNLVLEDAPTIKSMSISDITYDTSKMTLSNVEWLCDAEIRNWNSSQGRGVLAFGENTDANGPILKMSFVINKVADDANVSISCNMTVKRMDNTDNEIVVNSEIISGSITINNAIRGDMDNNGKLNSNDAVYLLYHVMFGKNDYPIHQSGDMDGNDKVNSNDAVYLLYHIMFGEEDYPIHLPCAHSMQHFVSNAATCTKDGNNEYWYCALCNNYFGDADGKEMFAYDHTIIPATGHTIVIDPAVPATYEHTGLTEGSHCSVCGIVIKAQNVIPKLEKTEYVITYHIANNDTYLQSLDIENSNPNVYTSEEGLKLSNLNVDGYIFDGWYDGEGANGELVKNIPSGTTGNLDLYARWSLKEYTVQFDSPDVPVESITYTVDKGVPLINPAKQFGYTFVGWSNDDGFLVSSIKPGTVGNITLHANWTSNRNKATSYASYDEPMIIEDDTKGQFMFIYNIGKIDNVPLNQISYLGNSDGIEINQQYDVSNAVTEETAKQVANTVANATTKSSGWTLSDEWEKIYAAGNELEEQKGKTTVRTDSEGNVTGGNYYVSNSSGGSSFVSNSSGGSNSSSSKVTTNNSVGINRSYDNKNSSYVDAKLGVSNTTEVSAGVSVPIKIAKVEAGVKNTTTVSAEVAGGLRNENSQHYDDSRSGSVGTYNEKNSSSYYNSVAEKSSTWNSTSGYEKSYQTSRNTEVSNAISEQISKKTTLNVTDAVSGSKSTNATDTYTDSSSEEYSSSVRYNSEDKSTTSQAFKYSSTEQGYYRLVNAGTVHVFAVVAYDVATNSYYTYTYNVLDDERHIYTDFSLSDPNFKDCENGVVSFEVPYEVNEYVVGLTGKSEGLQFSLNGTVTKYTSSTTDETVVVPQYYSANNGADNSKTAIKVTQISPTAFKGNQNIKTVVLPLYVDEIPDGAFEGCTNLENVIAFGVTKIGANAFKGCTNLTAFSIDNMVTSLGNNAFENVSELRVQAANESVFDAALNSGANRLIINTSLMNGTLDNKVINIASDKNYFALLSNGAKYDNLQIVSNSNETYISNMIFAENIDTPLKLKSEKVTLNRVVVENAPGFALILENDNTALSLYGTVDLGSTSENVILSKNLTLSEENPEVASEINSYGDVLVCGDVSNSSMLNVTDNNDNKYEKISEEEFQKFLTSSKITFDANGGEPDLTSKTVYYGQAYGEMPIPTKANYTFDGWYTAASAGTKITADTVVTALVNQTLYAHWTPNKFTVTYDVNGENATVSTTSKTLSFGDALGELPVPTREFYRFDGWFTEKDGGSIINESTTPDVAEDIIVYAHWSENSLSDWVKSSEMPSDAVAVNTKYSYTLRSYTTSSSSSMNGWTKYDTQRTSWGATQGPVYSNPSGNSRNVWSEQYVKSTTTHYKYYHRWNGKSGSSGLWGTDSTAKSWKRHTYETTSQMSHKYTGSSGIKFYGTHKCPTCGAQNMWVPDGSYKTNNYATRWYYQEPVYTYYYYKDENKETTTDPTGQSNVSNVQEWVQYRVK